MDHVLVHCDARWDKEKRRHLLKFGEDEFVPTVEVVRVAHGNGKGAHKIVILAEEVHLTVEDLLRRANDGPDWAKPLDPELEICLIEGDGSLPASLARYEVKNALEDFVAGKSRQDGKARKLALSDATILTVLDGKLVSESQRAVSAPTPALEREQAELLLHRCIAKRDLVAMEAVLAAGTAAKLNVNAFAGTATLSALSLAANSGWAEGVAVLLRQPGIDVNGRTAAGESALYLACEGAGVEVVGLLLADPRVEVGLTKDDGTTVLHAAARGGRAEVVALLLDDPRIPINQACKVGNTALHYACKTGGANLVALLLADSRVRASEVNRQNAKGNTPLHWAIFYNQVEVVRLLLECTKSVDISVRNTKEGTTPLHAAALSERAEIIELFLELRPGEELLRLANAPDAWGATPVALAAECGRDEKRVIDKLAGLTRMAAIRTAKKPTRDSTFAKALIVTGSRLSRLPLADHKTKASKGGVGLELLGDGELRLSWSDFVSLSAPDVDSAVFLCHGGFDKLLQRHMLEFGEIESVPTIDLAFECYKKEVFRMSFSACDILVAAERAARRINADPRWRKPLDPRTEIIFIGEIRTSLFSLLQYNLGLQVEDISPSGTEVLPARRRARRSAAW